MLDTAEGALREGYGATPTPNLTERFVRARQELEDYVRE